MTSKRQQARDSARTRRDKGITDSILHADHAARDWPDTAYSYLLQFAAITREPWTIEQFREWAREEGLPDPPDLRAFGGVTFRAKRLGLIEHVGYFRTNSSNLSYMSTYLGRSHAKREQAPAPPQPSPASQRIRKRLKGSGLY